MITYITLPIDIAESMLAYAGALFTDLTPLVILAVGLPMGFWVIRKVIALVKTR